MNTVLFMKAGRSNVIRLEKNKIKFNNSMMSDTVTKDGLSYTIPAKWK